MSTEALNRQQFEQPALFEGAGKPTHAAWRRAAYLTEKRDPTPLAARFGTEPSGGRDSGMAAIAHPWVPQADGAPRQQAVPLPERNNYAHARGQLVMGAHDLSDTHSLDEHGNVYIGKHSDAHTKGVGDQAWFDRYGPYNSPEHEQFWSDHAKVQDMRTSAVLHTGQHSTHTLGHGYIAGPMDPEKVTASIVRQGGVSYLADGHHRLAEARGRGVDSTKVRVLDLDEVNAAKRAIPMPSVKRSGDEMRGHLAEEHNVHPGMFAAPAYHTQNVGQRHDVLHRKEFAEHQHPNKARPMPEFEVPAGHFNF